MRDRTRALALCFVVLSSVGCGLLENDEPAPAPVAPIPPPAPAAPPWPPPAQPAPEPAPPPPDPQPAKPVEIPPATVRLGALTADGISAQIVRRVTRRHLNEVRFCYEQGLHRRTDLTGRVSASCTVTSSGSVHSCSVAESTLGDPQTEQCIEEAMERWTFPGLEGSEQASFTAPLVLVTE